MISTVISALNEGFAQTLKLFFVTLVGALPLGLLISFGSMSTWAPFRRIALSTIGQCRPGRFARFLVNFRPVSLLVRLIVWVVRGTKSTEAGFRAFRQDSRRPGRCSA